MNENEYRRLIRALKRSRKFFVYFAVCPARKRTAVIERAGAMLAPDEIFVLRLTEPTDDLLQTLLDGNPSPHSLLRGAFVTGLDESVELAATGQNDSFFNALNLSTEGFRRALDCPIVIFLDEENIAALARHAPDFYQRRSGTFRFERDE